MHAPPATSWPRRFAKFALFLARGHAPATAWWLAAHDAVRRNDYRNIPLTALASAWNATGTWTEIAAARGAIRSVQLDLEFRGDDLLAHGHPTLVALHKRGFTVERQDYGLLLTNRTHRLRLTTTEELSIVQEIFVEGCYDFHVGGVWNVLDVGANVGLASLFFAAQPWAHQVMAFEPFGPTADDHAANVSLNPTLAPKIKLHRCGLGDRPETLSVEYHPQLRGSMSVHGLGSWRGAAAPTGKMVPIEVRRASAVLAELAPALAGRPTLLKLDCEGSEYAILRDLEETGWLRRLDLIVMETHQRQPDELIDRLQRAGFDLHVRAMVPDRTQCLVLAWRAPATP